MSIIIQITRFLSSDLSKQYFQAILTIKVFYHIPTTMLSVFKANDLAKKILLEYELSEDEKKSITNNTEQIVKVLYWLNFDCTPSRWVSGVEQIPDWNYKLWSQNRYLQNKENMNQTIENRIKNINISVLKKTLQQAIIDLFWKKINISWFGIYWSYVYGDEWKKPDDLDILITLEKDYISADALKYTIEQPIKDTIYYNSKLRIPNSNDLWLTIISKKLYEKENRNRNFVVTDAALLAMSTVVNFWSQIIGRPIPPYIIHHNINKMIYRWKTWIAKWNNSLQKRWSEALFMREYLKNNYPYFDFAPIDRIIVSQLNSSNIAIQIETANRLLQIFKEDEQKIKEYYAKKLQ